MTFDTSELRFVQSPIELAFDSATSRPPLFVAVAVAVAVAVVASTSASPLYLCASTSSALGAPLCTTSSMPHSRLVCLHRARVEYAPAASSTQRAPATSSKPPPHPAPLRRVQYAPAVSSAPPPRLVRPHRAQYAPAALSTPRPRSVRPGRAQYAPAALTPSAPPPCPARHRRV
ncbi:hypothetical protein DENSPDRAFT_885814 [Dentipellis sp. KUC8613]|nr:hypothetical protein DENSPDRAFT_885814 [Dentipellis sp. KUC8613]